MLPRNHPDRIRVSFDDHRLVANAGLLLPATLAHHLGLRELVDHHLDLGVAPRRANTGDKMLTLVASALAGGDCIDDADALRAGGTARILGGTIKAPSTLGTFLRSFRWGHVRQLDRVSRELAGTRLAGRRRTRRLAPDHRPGLNHLRDLRTGQGRGTPPRLYRQAGLSPAAGCRRRNRRRADVPACARAGPTPLVAPPTSCVKRWGGCATEGPAGNSRCGPTAASTPIAWYPSAASWTCASPSPSASTKACGT